MTDAGLTHTLMGGKLHVYKRPGSRFWQCSAYEAGRNRRVSTKEESLGRAKQVAEDWYLELRGKLRSGEIRDGKTFKEAAAQFEREYEIITQGQRSPRYVQGQKDRLRVHLVPFFGRMSLSEITPGQVQEYRIARNENSKNGKALARSTIHQEIVALRQVLKTAVRHGWLSHLPDLSAPYRASGKIAHRAWFRPRNTARSTRRPAGARRKPGASAGSGTASSCTITCCSWPITGLRPDEAARLEFRDVKIVEDEYSGETILEIVVRGKRGVGYCMSMPGAVTPFKRIVKRNDAQGPTGRLFPIHHRELLNAVCRFRRKPATYSELMSAIVPK